MRIEWNAKGRKARLNRFRRNLIKVMQWFKKNLANSITLLRFVLCAVAFWIIITNKNALWILIVLTVAALTDLLDGWVARNFSGVTKFGTDMDRIGDKLLLGNMFLFLIQDQRIYPLLKVATVPSAIIEILLSALLVMGLFKGTEVSAGKAGKRKMFILSTTMLVCMTRIVVEERLGVKIPHIVDMIFIILLLVSMPYGWKSIKGHLGQYRQLPGLQKNSA